MPLLLSRHQIVSLLSSNNSQGKPSNGEKGQQPADVLPGYMPLRGDFDVEHDNEAEMIIKDMEFDPNEDPSEKELKLQVVEVYNK